MKYVLGPLALIILIAGLMFAGRYASVFNTETSAMVYDSSRQFQQGTNRDLARYCRQWRDADGAGKLAVAELIRSTRDTYQGTLTPANQTCIDEVN